MKISRHRRVRRSLNFYKNNFNFRTPYQVLVDVNFCLEALNCKLNIQEQLPKYLDAEVKHMTTACVIKEVEALVQEFYIPGKKGSEIYGAMLIVKQFKTRKCGHEKEPVSAAECIHSMLAEVNPDHYFVATQDAQLSEKVRSIPGAPLLYIKYNAIILEKPSEIDSAKAETKSKDKLNAADYHSAVLKEMKKEVFGEEKLVQRKRKRAKGPNPLSCKKKKINPRETSTEEKIPKKRRQRKTKIDETVEI